MYAKFITISSCIGKTCVSCNKRHNYFNTDKTKLNLLFSNEASCEKNLSLKWLLMGRCSYFIVTLKHEQEVRLNHIVGRKRFHKDDTGKLSNGSLFNHPLRA